MNKSHRLIIVLFFSIFAHQIFAQKISLKQELDASEMAKVEKGELLLKTTEVKGSAWPIIDIYQIVDATPLECMGIFSAVDYQKEYVPNILKSTPIKQISSLEVLTEYEMHTPFPLPNAHYIHGSVIHKYDNDYELTWYRVESSSTEEVKGSSYFTSFNNKTLFRYRSYIKPKSILASMVKKIMFKDVQASLLAIKTHIEKLKKENSPLITKYSDFITRSINGDFVYKDLIEKK